MTMGTPTTKFAQSDVLIVEDEPRLRDLLARALPGMGFSATSARNAEEAVKAMDAAQAGIVLLDLNLPGMTGMEFFHKLRERWSQTQVIILTGFGDLESAREAIRLDVVDFLTKPCHLGDLEQALDRARKRITKDPTAGLYPWPADNDGAKPPKLEEIERQHIMEALERNHGNRTAAATELGISLRTLYYRLNEYQKLGFKVE